MPTYLCHGFRWQRRSIRVFVVVQDLDDASPEWIIRKATARALLDSFYGLFDFLPSCSPPRPPRSRSASASTTLSRAQHPVHHYSHSQTRVRSRTRSQQGRRNGTGSVSRSSSVVRGPVGHVGRSRAGTEGSRERSVGRRGSRSPATAGRRRMANTNSNATGEFEDDTPQDTRGRPEDDGFEDEPDPDPEAEEEEDAVLAQQWSPVRLLEEYDPQDLTSVSQPWAYVADHVIRVDVSASITDEIASYERKLREQQTRYQEDRGRRKGSTSTLGAMDLPAMAGASTPAPSDAATPSGGWLERLRDQLQRGEQIGWYIVVNGDEERAWPENPTPPPSNSVTASIREGVMNGDEDGGTPTSAPRRQAEHGYYTYQQKLFEGADRSRERERDKERARERLRAELGGKGMDIGSGPRERHGRRDTRRDTVAPPKVPEKDVPAVKASPKTPVKTPVRPPVVGHKSTGSGIAAAGNVGASPGGASAVQQQNQMHAQGQQYEQKPQPRMPKQGGFRRLFGRSKSSFDEGRSAKG